MYLRSIISPGAHFGMTLVHSTSSIFLNTGKLQYCRRHPKHCTIQRHQNICLSFRHGWNQAKGLRCMHVFILKIALALLSHNSIQVPVVEFNIGQPDYAGWKTYALYSTIILCIPLQAIIFPLLEHCDKSHLLSFNII